MADRLVPAIEETVRVVGMRQPKHHLPGWDEDAGIELIGPANRDRATVAEAIHHSAIRSCFGEGFA